MANDDTRFWSYVAQMADEDCWLWTGHTTASGYGVFWYDGKNRRANRMALFFSGKLPPSEESLAIHSCDNPTCCNPSHLRWGTHADNVEDMLVRSRTLKGSDNPNSQIDEATARQIFRLRQSGETCREIAESLGIPYSLVMNVYIGRAWGHLLGTDGLPTLKDLRKSKPVNRAPAHNRVVSDQLVDHILQSRMAGKKIAEIASELGLPAGTVSPVYGGFAFTHRHGVDGNPTLSQLRSVRAMPKNQKLTSDDRQEIRALLAAGYTGKSIAARFGVTPSIVSNIKTRS